MSTLLKRCFAILLLVAVTPAFAQLSQYGYVIGNLEPTKSFLEKLDAPDKGKYLHYHIFLTTASNAEYEVVIDVNDVSPTNPLIYRLASIGSDTSADYGPIYSATSDFHIISNTQASYGPILTPTDAQKQAAGALDYIRHPGLLKAIRGLPWQTMLAQTTSDPLQWALPALDAVFKAPTSSTAFTKVYVFGAPFTSGGNGMHVVHQNQADVGAQYSGTNGTWQDGGVIIERHTYFSAFHFWFITRQVLMTKFSNQTDFSAETNDLAKPAAPGHTLAPTTQNISVGLICDDIRDFGPFAASQLQVTTSGVVAEPDGPTSTPEIEVHVKNGAFTDLNDAGDFVLVDQSTNTSAAGRVFGRAYSPISLLYFPIGKPPTTKWIPINFRSDYYVRVHAIDPNGQCDSAVGGTLSVSYY